MTDPLDERILAALDRDGRADVPAIADAVDATIPAVRERIDALEADGTIEGYTARLDHETLGHVTAVFHLRVGHEAVADLLARLEAEPWIVSLYETTGHDPVVAVGRFRDGDALADRITWLHHDPAVEALTAARVDRIGCERDGLLRGD